jgi:hypothetical protein
MLLTPAPLIVNVLSTKQVLPSSVVAPPTATTTSLNGKAAVLTPGPGSVLKNLVFSVSVIRYVPGVRFRRLPVAQTAGLSRLRTMSAVKRPPHPGVTPTSGRRTLRILASVAVTLVSTHANGAVLPR